MALAIGSRIGSYDVVALLGAGGMGEVYRAHDARLDRDVAIKILPDAFACDPGRLARFQREAKTLAALNHPHIGAIYGLEEANGMTALVLELVEGATLADRISHGSIPFEEAMEIANQIAEALEAAHEHGIIHRDLKPANIKVRDDGAVKVLDFGLAKALAPEPASAAVHHVAQSPTITSPVGMTGVGMLLGTAAYMSPEQARGKAADKRSDIWAFGCVLYEMLTGARAFASDDVSDTLAAVLRGEPEWRALKADTPASIRRLLRRCLEKDRKRRLSDIADARLEIDDALTSEPRDVARTTIDSRAKWRRDAVVAAVALVVGVTATAAAVWYFTPPLPQPQVTRFVQPLPDGYAFLGALSRHVMALSPDGMQMVFVAGASAGDTAAAPSNSRLFLRSMSSLEVHTIQGVEDVQGVSSPVFSPDGRSVLFYSSTERAIKKIPVAGGRALTICRAENPFGVSWTPEGIVFGQGRGGILRVSPDGGTPTIVVRVREGEEAHGPQLLPGGEHVLFTLATTLGPDRWTAARIVVHSLISGESKTLIEGGSDARYIPTGHLIYAREGTLFAVPFDLGRLTLTGDRAQLIDRVSWSAGRTTGASHFSVANTGTVIYLGGVPAFNFDRLSIVLTDRKGVIERLPIQPGRYSGARMSPDGQRIAFGTDDGTEAIIYTYELSAKGAMQRLTFGGNNRFPIWSSDGKYLAFQSDRGGDLAVWQSSLDGSAERLTTAGEGESHAPESWSPTGEALLFSVTTLSDVSLWSLSLPARTATRFGDVRSTYPINARFHPSGRWVAYSSTERDTFAIYVQPFPATGGKYQLLVGGAAASPHKPVWSRDGKELFYVPRIGEFEAVAVSTDPTFIFGKAVRVPRPFQPGPPGERTLFDVTPDGKFVGFIAPRRSDTGFRPISQIHIVVNALEELPRSAAR